MTSERSHYVNNGPNKLLDHRVVAFDLAKVNENNSKSKQFYREFGQFLD